MNQSIPTVLTLLYSWQTWKVSWFGEGKSRETAENMAHFVPEQRFGCQYNKPAKRYHERRTDDSLASTVAAATGAKVKWAWSTIDQRANKDVCNYRLEQLVTSQTRIVAISHASNLLGQLRDVSFISKRVKELSPIVRMLLWMESQLLLMSIQTLTP
jgi:hypothetical protein